MVYVPPVIIEELENIKFEEELEVNTEAYRRMAKYCFLGREVARTKGFTMGKARKNKKTKHRLF